MNGKVQAL